MELDAEEARAIDLTAAALGDTIMEFAARSCREAASIGTNPETGEPWEELAASTVRQKGFNLIGVRTGTMLGTGWDAPAEISPTSARWTYTGPDYARHFHQQRQLIGWTPEAQFFALQQLTGAVR
jgi:hypothetical protein